MEIPFFNIFQFIVIRTGVGFLGGFLGVGGGIIMIPLLHYWAFPAMHISPEVIVHLSFGTSMAIIIFTSLSSACASAGHLPCC
ncbi:MAG: TSUP family transporter [Deltaproteobacteria bacterium]|nr:TSUP family transporter [Deltaproteobacteria bacterium]